MPRKTTEEFIKQCKVVHKDRYDYSKVLYKGALEDVEIFCELHGSFWQQANVHVRGGNCPICTGRSFSIKKFLDKANSVHDNKYTYENVVYINAKEKVAITCKTHGTFMQIPGDHVKGRGCPECAIIRTAESLRLDNDLFLEKATAIHGDKYDYSLTNYKSYKEPVEINCKQHGVFKQTPAIHLRGSGCTHCGRSSGFNRTRFVNLVSSYGKGYLYLVRLYNLNENFYKIGITCKELSKRMNCLPFNKEVLCIETLYDGGRLFDLENELHSAFRSFRYSPSVSFSGEKECYSYINMEIFHDIVSKYRR